MTTTCIKEDRIFNPPSNIDLACNKILSVEPNLVSMLASRFVFPKHKSDVHQFKDNRTPSEKFVDVINIINGKIKPEMAELWSEICQYDIKHECYYKSGISYLERDMKLLQKNYKYSKKLELDPNVNMPDIIKTQGHSKFCEPTNEKCVYATQAILKNAPDLINNLFQNNQDIYSTLSIKANAKLLIIYLLQNANKFFKFLNECLKIVNKKAYILSSKRIFRLYKTGCAYLNLMPAENKVKTAFISDLTC